jgi:hypothetical protein
MTDAISGDRQNRFTDDELEALARDDSSSSILNKARHDAGYKDPSVELRGDSLAIVAFAIGAVRFYDWLGRVLAPGRHTGSPPRSRRSTSTSSPAFAWRSIRAWRPIRRARASRPRCRRARP